MTAGPSGESDGTLAKRSLSGHRAAFNILVRRYQDPLYRFIRRYVGDADESYDLLQETMVAAWQALGRYDSERPALAWLRSIALNKCRDWARRRTVRQFFFRAAPLETAGAAAATIETPEDANLARLDAAVAALPLQLKEPLLLTVFEGLSQQEAADVLGVTVKAVETRIYRARKLLAEALQLAAKTDDAEGTP